MHSLLAKIPALLLTLIVGLIASSSAFAATILIQNNDAPGVGFNDPSPPVAGATGNTGITLGDQRLKAFEEAARIWGATLTSGPTIVIRAQWAAQTCSASSGTLGSAGNSGNIWRDFPGSVPGFWYGNALANALRNTDLNGASVEINATFNVNLGTPGCLETLHWYYGLDNNHGATGVDLVAVLLHEFAHGLGFQTFTSSSTGLQTSGFPTIYDRFLFDNTKGKTWAQMTDLERQASAKNTRRLAWNGSQVVSDVPSVLALGTPLFRVNSPLALAGVYPIGTAAFGPPLSSPGVTGNLVQALDVADGIGPSTTDGCSALTNPAAISGNIAMIDRGPTGGSCSFALKVKNAQNAGAIGVVIANNVAGSPPGNMGGTDGTITIPSLMIALSDGDNIKAQLGSGVNVTLTQDPAVRAGADPSGRALVFTPDPVAGGSSVSHWDTSESPNQLMEPNISNDLTHSVTPPQDLTQSLLKDIGWPTGSAPPPPSPTPTPSPPANDNFANAQLVTGCFGSVAGTNVGATHEWGEPSHDSATPPDPGASSVWYQWQAPSTGSVTITTAGSNYDTMLGVYTGTSVGSLTVIAKNDDVNPGIVTTSTVTFSATTATIYRIAVDGWGGATGSIVLNWDASNCVDSAAAIHLSARNYSVGEGTAFKDILVTRSNTSTAATIDYSTNDYMAPRCDTVSGIASAKCDYVTSGGTLRFAAGEASKTIVLSIIDDAFLDGNEVLSITLTNPTGAPLGSPTSAIITILDNDTDPNAANPYLNNAFFVRQQYLDFLLREPDTAGYTDWLTRLNGCGPEQGGLGAPAGCDRVEVSSGFFRSTEFGEKGYWVYRFYQGALGRRPQFAEFTSEMRRLSGLMTDAEQETRRADFITRFMQLPEFTGIYAGLTTPAKASDFITKLEQEAGVTLPASAQTLPGQPTQYGRAQLIGLMQNGTLTPGQTLRAFIEQQVVWDKYFFRAFVAMQYFGYLRRDPEDAGYNDWVRVLTLGDAPTGIQPGDYRHLIFGFVYSVEYRERFGNQ